MDKNFSIKLLRAYLDAAEYRGQLFYFEEAESTQKSAKNFINKNGTTNALFITDRQTDGRGRNNRCWISSAYKSLTFSLLTRPVLLPEQLSYTGYAAGLAVQNALRSHNICTQLKWPNDLLLTGKKIGGILSESAVVHNTVFYLITGFGINVNQTANDFSDDIKDVAVSLRTAYNEEFCREQLTAEIVTEYLKLLTLLEITPAELLKIYKNRCDTIGKNVKIMSDNFEISGIAEDINTDGSILINKNGEKHSFFAADITHLR